MGSKVTRTPKVRLCGLAVGQTSPTVPTTVRPAAGISTSYSVPRTMVEMSPSRTCASSLRSRGSMISSSVLPGHAESPGSTSFMLTTPVIGTAIRAWLRATSAAVTPSRACSICAAAAAIAASASATAAVAWSLADSARSS